MPDKKPQAKHLKDYLPSAWLIDDVELHFELGEEHSIVRSQLSLRRNPAEGAATGPPILHGRKLELVSLELDGRELRAGDYSIDEESLTLPDAPDSFTLAAVTRIKPQENTSLEGLYKSGGNFCTQCEAEGFRKITYFLDRTDVMARYTTTIAAEKAKYPVLLSNGNLVDSGEGPDGRHWARWEDPFPKPSYLFALVAGDLVHREDSFTTMSGRKVTLRIYVRERDRDKTPHAMRSLQKAMKWDEEVYGREYDLDIFNIVAVDDFNMGAMENKSLNIFNTQYVLAKQETATDSDYVNVEAVIAHEYFHNWTGNRVTVCNWFQLSLKEGLTVFRDQQFTADMNSAAVERIDSVEYLRKSQFAEDAGPQAHPVRPSSYIEMNNFYTTTVYEKGAELIRMMHTVLGEKAYRQGMDLYFERHDGRAVTTDDFVAAMEDASGIDLGQFRLWYDQAGTPTLKVARDYDAKTKTYTLNVDQSVAPSPGQSEKQPMHIPLAMSLLDSQGGEIPLQLAGEKKPAGGECVLDVKAPQERFRFINVPEEPVPSLLRRFSAPVHLEVDLSHEELSFLMAKDTDSFNRWEAGQRLATDLLLGLIADHQAGRTLSPAPALAAAFAQVLASEELDPALAARTLVLPDEITLAGRVQLVDPVAIHEARQFLRRAIGAELRESFLATYRRNRQEGPYEIDPVSMGRRSLANLCLAYLLSQGDAESRQMASAQFDGSSNMTDTLSALASLANTDCPEREEVLSRFYETWREETLVVNKWLGIQARCHLPGTLGAVKDLMEHEAFDIKNPNKVRSLISTFAHGNLLHFHAADGEGYEFVAEQVLRLDKLNPQVAARLTGAFNRWRKFDAARQELTRIQLERIVSAAGISRNVYEIAARALGGKESAPAV